MFLNRILTVTLVAASSAWAQLPPSSLNPTRPQPAPPVQPVAPTPVQPTQPPDPVRPIRGPFQPETPQEDPASPPSIDFSNTIPNTLTPEEKAQGWRLLFDGTRLTGLKGVQRSDPTAAGWQIANGELNLPKEIRQMDSMTGGDLVTMETFWDFDFRFEWKATVSSNGGIRYMLASAVGQTPVGLEYQIIDDVHAPIGLKGGLLRRTGALDNIIAVGANARLRTADPLARKGDPWNEGRIVVKGNRVEHWLNGDKVLEFDLGPQLRTAAERNAQKGQRALGPYFGQKVKTALCILDEGTEIAFRNLKVRPLAPQAVVATPNGTRPTAPVAPIPGTGTKPAVPDPFLIKPKR